MFCLFLSSDRTRDSKMQDVYFKKDQKQKHCIKQLKNVLTFALVMSYFNVNEDSTLSTEKNPN